MNKLISQDIIDRYLIRKIKTNNNEIETIFEYTGKETGDTQELAIGFINTTKNQSYIDSIYLPTVNTDGMIQRNSNLWYPIIINIPPLMYTGLNNRIEYLESIINPDIMVKTVEDFMPVMQKKKSDIITPLMRKLMPEVPEDINNLYNWNAIDLPTALVELFNIKIISQVKRSFIPGFSGVNGVSKALNTLITAMTKYYSDSNEEIMSYSYNSDDDQGLINLIAREDKKGVVISHPVIKSISIGNDIPLDFCTCSSSNALITSRIISGVSIDDYKYKGKPDFPYAEYRKAIPGILHDDPHRVIVSRSIYRSMILDSTFVPYVQTEKNIGIDCVCYPGVRMTHPLNMEDGIVVSKTFAEAASAFKVKIEKFMLPLSFTVDHRKEICDEDEKEKTAKLASSDRKNTDLDEYKRSVIKPGDILADVYYKGVDGEPVHTTINSSINIPAVLTNREEIETYSGDNERIIMYKFTYLIYFPLSVGSKLSDAHANKATVSAILPDEEMPLWEGERCHYIATPYIMKRLSIGAEVEDKLALIGKYKRDTGESGYLQVKSTDYHHIDDLDNKLKSLGLQYTGSVEYADHQYENIPISYRMMFRLDNNPEETLSIRSGIVMNDRKRVSKNSKLSLDIITLLTRGANNLINELIHKSNSKFYIKNSVVPIMNAINDRIPEGSQTYNITAKMDRSLIGRPVSPDNVIYEIKDGEKIKRDFTNTVCDERSKNAYGIMHYKNVRIVVPPHDGFTEMQSGMVILNKIAVMANRVISEIASGNQVGPGYVDIERCIDRYYSTLSSTISGRNGLLRDAIWPVFPKSIRAVFTPYVGMDIMEIRIPKRAYHRMMKKSGEEFNEFYRNKNLCILKRDPVHRNNNFIAVKFKPWDNDTIGIHPALITILDGDYDGDAGVVAFPSTTLGYNDLFKLFPDFENAYKGSKQLYKSSPGDVTTDLLTNVGWSSTFRNPHESDILKNEELYEKLIEGLDMDTALFEAVKAAKDFNCIKEGTAMTGALCLKYIFTRDINNMYILNQALELYHEMAQCTLDAKSGVPAVSLQIVDAFNENKPDAVKKHLNELGFTDEESVRDFVKFCRMSKEDLSGFLDEYYPILSMIQRGVKTKRVSEMVRFILSGEDIGSGIMESLFTYLLDSSKVMPFECKIDINELYQHSLMAG